MATTISKPPRRLDSGLKVLRFASKKGMSRPGQGKVDLQAACVLQPEELGSPVGYPLPLFFFGGGGGVMVFPCRMTNPETPKRVPLL